MLISLIVLVCFLCKRKGPSGGHILYSSGNRIAIQPSTPQPGPACPPTQQQQQQQPVYVLSGQAVDYHPSPTTHQIPGQSSAYPQPPQPATTHEIPGQSSAYPQPSQPPTTTQIQQ
ncbi:uncharacterized protein LOC110456647 [Mizuhopecten yessoensis]|uniref:uncharacterized protein LOC110456647 n=1 Tax=Mizuhopecten yessoensis TaxID=6573 RepID=UPI000B4572E6|nr:uncharacterized protein LOC110456647 [Mizuhopecten yessoensis]